MKEKVDGEQAKMLCSGDCNEQKPCDHIKDCQLCFLLYVYEDGKKFHVINMGVNSLLCKRDHSDFKPMTKKQFFETYKKLPLHKRTNISIGFLLEKAVVDGIVIGE